MLVPIEIRKAVDVFPSVLVRTVKNVSPVGMERDACILVLIGVAVTADMGPLHHQNALSSFAGLLGKYRAEESTANN